MASCNKLDRIPRQGGHPVPMAAAVASVTLPSNNLQTPWVYTTAGSGIPTFQNGTGTGASFNAPGGIVAWKYGMYFVADKNNHMIRKIFSDGTVIVLAGSGSPGSANGTGTAASFRYPTAVAADDAGNVFVADSGNHQIRKITTDGVVTTIGGSRQGYTEEGPATAALFNGPNGIAVDRSGVVYISDAGNFRVRKITTDGFVHLLAGSGSQSFGDNPGDLASFDQMSGIALDTNRNVYVADAGNHRIRMITPTGNVSTLAGQDNAGNADGGPGVASFTYPAGLSVDPSGTVYVTEQAFHRVRKIAPDGTVSALAGNGIASWLDGAAAGAEFKMPAGVACDRSGLLYIADQGNNRIRVLGTKQTNVSTLAGNGNIFAPFSDGTGTAATFTMPAAVAMDAAGNTYVADYGNNRIRKITPAGVVTTLAGDGVAGFADGTGGAARFNGPQGIAIDNTGTLYVSDTYNERIRKVTLAGVVTTLAGSATAGFADGPDITAKFYTPQGIAVDAAGNVFVADIGNQRIRKITPAGVVSTYAGNGTGGMVEGPADQAKFYNPAAVAVDASGNVYVADASNNRIRKISPARIVSTLAGDGNATAFPFQGTVFQSPTGVAVDAYGTVYVADSYNDMIRKVTPGGGVGTVAGNGHNLALFYRDGLGYPATSQNMALLNHPTGIAIDASGSTLIIADQLNYRIRKIQ